MISTANMDPSNCANAELSWKKVKKGFRSATRRPRKINQGLNIGLQHNNEGSKDEPSVAESEKLGVAVLGNHFSEKIDHLPLKKRRPMQLPVPPSPQIPFNKSSRIKKFVVNKNRPCLVDSYGIELLAAAACDTSIIDEVLNVKAVKVEEKIKALPESNASLNATLLEETIICSQKENSSLEETKTEAHPDLKEQINFPVVSGEIHDKSDIEAGKGTSGKDVKFHWDLNTVMDEWETENLENGTQPKDPEHGWELLKCSSEIKNSADLIGKLECPISGLSLGLDSIPTKSPFKENMNSPTTKMTLKVEENHGISSDFQLGKHNIVMVDSTISEKIMRNVVRIKYNEDKMSKIPDGRNTLNLMGTSLDGEDFSNKSGPCVKGRVLKDHRYRNVHSQVALEDFLDDGDVSDNSPRGHRNLLRIGKNSNYQSGFESPVEDGELRESFAHSWQENEDELDCVDYDIDDRDGAEAASGSNRIINYGKVPEKITSGKIDSSKESSLSVSTGNSSGRDRIPEGCERVAKTVEENNVKLGEIVAFNFNQKFDVKGSLDENIGSRGIVRGKFSRDLQGSFCSGAFYEKGSRDVQRSSGGCFQDRQVYCSDKYFGRDKPDPRMQDGCLKNNWNYKNNYQRAGGNPRPRNNTHPDANNDDLSYDDHRRPRNNYMKDGYRPLDRRRPPDDNDNRNYINRGDFVRRDDSHYNRGRGGSRFYKRGFIEGNRDEFRDRSNSPIYNNNRDFNFSRPGRKSRSRSRSRSRSPVPWHLQRERNMGPRRISRSPDFGSRGRMGRNRMHYIDSKLSDDEDVFCSPPRKRFFNDRNNSGPTRFRERESPGRFVGQRQRFGSNGTGGRMKMDDGGFRPRFNSERFCEQSGGGRRGYDSNNHNYDSDSERKRFNNKHEMIRRVRHSDTDGAARHFRSNTDDCFQDHYNRNDYDKNNSCFRSTKKSDPLGDSREKDRCNFKFDGDKTGKFKFGCDKMDTFKLDSDKTDNFKFDGNKTDNYKFDGDKTDNYKFDGDKTGNIKFDGDKMGNSKFDGNKTCTTSSKLPGVRDCEDDVPISSRG